MKRASTLVKTTTEKALANFVSGVWEPIGELSPSGSVKVYHTVIKDRFQVLIVDYKHVERNAS